MKVYLIKAENEWAEDGYEIVGIALSLEKAQEMQNKYMSQDELWRMERCDIIEMDADKFYADQDELKYVG